MSRGQTSLSSRVMELVTRWIRFVPSCHTRFLMGLDLLIIDDNRMFQRHARRFLDQAETDVATIEAASDAADGLAHAQALQPDVILLDLSMPGAGGLDVIADLRAAVPDARIIVLTRHDDPLYADQALQEGADAFVSKLHMTTDLVDEVGRTH